MQITTTNQKSINLVYLLAILAISLLINCSQVSCNSIPKSEDCKDLKNQNQKQEYLNTVETYLKKSDRSEIKGYISSLEKESTNISRAIHLQKYKCENILDQCKDKFSLRKNCQSYEQFSLKQAYNNLESSKKDLSITKKFYKKLIEMVLMNHKECKKIKFYYTEENRKLLKNQVVTDTLLKQISLRLNEIKEIERREEKKEERLERNLSEAKAERIKELKKLGYETGVATVKEMFNKIHKERLEAARKRARENAKYRKREEETITLVRSSLRRQLKKTKGKLYEAKTLKKETREEQERQHRRELECKSTISLLEIKDKNDNSSNSRYDIDKNTNLLQTSVDKTSVKKIVEMLSAVKVKIASTKQSLKKEKDLLKQTYEELLIIKGTIETALVDMLKSYKSATKQCQERLELYTKKKEQLLKTFVRMKIDLKILKKNYEIEVAKDTLCKIARENTRNCNRISKFCFNYQVNYNEEKNELEDVIHFLKEVSLQSRTK